MKRLLLSLVVLTAIMSSCTTYKKAVRAMDSWNGCSKQELFSQWGAPNDVFPLDDGEILIYYGNTHFHHNVAIGTTTGSETCKMQFYINDSEKVYSNRFENCGRKYIMKKKRR